MKQPPKNKSIFNKEFKKGDNRPNIQYLKSLDIDNDSNTSISDVAIEAGMNLIGGKLASKALAKIGGGNIKRIGGKISNFFNSYINPSSGKNIIKETAKMTSKNHPNYFKPNRTFSDLKGDGSLRVDPINTKPKVPKKIEYTSIPKGKTNREGIFGMQNKTNN